MKTIIMAGGRGERLWPLSRTNLPKQLAPLPLPTPSAKDLHAQHTLLAQTINRIQPLLANINNDVFISTQETQLPAIQKNCPPSLPTSQFILEPAIKDTAPAILLAALTVKSYCANNDDPVLFFTPADHYIANLPHYQADIQLAAKIAQNTNTLTLIGIPPTYPATTYGYLEVTVPSAGAPPFHSNLSAQEHAKIYQISHFHEKPPQNIAEAYLKQGNFYWNAGMFFIKSSALITIFQKYAPAIFQAVTQYLKLIENNQKKAALATFNSINKISIDYAIVEKLPHVYAIKANFSWDDLGTLASLERIHSTATQAQENTFLGNTTHISSFACHNTFVHHATPSAHSPHLVLNKTKDLSIIITNDVIYIADKANPIPHKILLQNLAQTNKKLL